MNGQNEPLVSIVTPFYNTDEYIAECIESVQAQTYRNWEYILLNNCSTDESAEIARRYAERDQRIRLIHNDVFLTQVQNYNHALRKISQESRYCKIVQADDWIFPECLSKMVSVAEANPSVGIVGSYRLYGRDVGNVGIPYTNKVVGGREVCRMQLIDGYYFFGSPTSILLRSEIIRSQDPFYDETVWFEDAISCFKILQTWDFGFVHQITSFERVDNESISSEVRNFDRGWLLARLIIFMECGKLFLDLEEYERIFNTIKNNYFSFLSKNVFRRRGKDFFEYHKKGLATVGYELSYNRLSKHIILEVIDLCFNLKDTAEIILKKLKSWVGGRQ